VAEGESPHVRRLILKTGTFMSCVWREPSCSDVSHVIARKRFVACANLADAPTLPLAQALEVARPPGLALLATARPARGMGSSARPRPPT